MEKKNNEDHEVNHRNRYLKFATISLILLVLVLVAINLNVFFAMFTGLAAAMSSILYGILFAYLANPLVRFAEDLTRPLLQKTGKERFARQFSRIIGLLFAFSIIALFIYLLVTVIAPQIGSSIAEISTHFPGYFESIEKWVMGLLENPDIRSFADTVMENVHVFLEDFINKNLVGSAQAVLSALTSSAVAVVSTLFNMLIGVVVSVYILLTKDKLLAQSKKMTVAFFSQSTAGQIMEYARQIDRIFNGFIIGKIIDSAIIGVLCYIGNLILDIPYAVLIAVIVGVTNVIPYFGPFLGAIPSALLILLVDPLECLYFLIFVVILQQVDGNVIGPKILGGNVGISSFWILVSITVAGGLFGFVGMLLGVPVFATFYMLISDIVNRSLTRRGLSTETKDYVKFHQISDLFSEEDPQSVEHECKEENSNA